MSPPETPLSRPQNNENGPEQSWFATNYALAIICGAAAGWGRPLEFPGAARTPPGSPTRRQDAPWIFHALP